MAVADVGTQVMMVDPTGAPLGAWQPGKFQGFSVLNEPGAPSWFELHPPISRRPSTSTARCSTGQLRSESDTDDFRYSVMQEPGGAGQFAGIMDARSFLDGPSSWTVYWEVANATAGTEKVTALGGKVISPAEKPPTARWQPSPIRAARSSGCARSERPGRAGVRASSARSARQRTGTRWPVRRRAWSGLVATNDLLAVQLISRARGARRGAGGRL